ncbi:MAG: hypothetical protein ACXWP4_12010 [Polyangiales bacterium]
MTKQILLACAFAATLVGCSDDDPSDTRSTPDAASDSGTTFGDAIPTDTGSESETSADSTTPIDSGSGDVATDAADSKPVDAGTDKDCIDATSMAAFFTLKDDTKCLVAKYDVASASLGSLTWGRHGGPLGFNGGATPQLVRYQVPATATGTITAMTTDVAVPSVPSGVFWGGAAYDLPFFGWTAFSYTGSGTGFPGEVVLATSSGALTRYHVNGFFSAVGVGLSSTSGGRLIHTSVSPLSETVVTTNKGGVYAADSCGSAATSPRLVPGTDTSCKAPFEIASWEAGSSGPVVVDPNENLFAINSTFGGKQELRGFERSTIARGAGATSGTKVFSIDGYTSELVADGSAVYFQSNDPSSFTALDVQTIAYSVSGTTLSPVGDIKTFLQLTKPGTSVSLVRDDLGRIWVGVTVPGTGDAGATSSTFFVLRAKNP